jgi:plastocyanin
VAIRVTSLLAALALTVAAVGCGSSSKKADQATTPDVSIVDFGFSPKQTTIKPGQTVTWTNDGQVDHTVKGKGFFTTRALGHGQKFSHRFTSAGSFKYLCTLHPSLMAGTVVVSG